MGTDKSHIWRSALHRSAFLFALILNATACLAADAGNVMQAWGAGNKSCGKYLSDVAEFHKEAEDAYVSWLAGYATAFNAQTPGVRDVLRGTDLDGAISWINNYCRDHPTDIFWFAAKRLTEFMQAK